MNILKINCLEESSFKELSLLCSIVLVALQHCFSFTATLQKAVDTCLQRNALPIAIIIGLLNGISLLIKWKKTNTKELIRDSALSVVISFVLTIIIVVFGGMTKLLMILLTFSSAFALVVNGQIAINIVKGNLKNLGAYVAHIGIAIFILGVIGSMGFKIRLTLIL
jgi:cytochrome c-type biogenesis protein CcmF